MNLFNLTVEKSLSREPSLGKAQVILLTQRCRLKARKCSPPRLNSSSTNHEPVQPDGGEITAKTAPPYLGKFEVVDNSFVRDRPAANANVITTLRRGTQVMVESKTGDYLRVRSLNRCAG